MAGRADGLSQLAWILRGRRADGVLERRAAYRRQGHFALSRRLLACVFDEPGTKYATQHRSSRLVDARRQKDEQEPGQRRGSARGRKRLRAGAISLFLVARGAVRPRRRFFAKSDHQPHKFRACQRAWKSAQPHRRHERKILGLRHKFQRRDEIFHRRDRGSKLLSKRRT